MEAYLPAFHLVLAEIHSLEFDAEAVFSWAHCEDSIYRRNRKQLIAALPVFAITLASEPSIPALIELAAVVDRANSLVDNLARMARVRKQSVSYLIGKPVMDLGPAWLNAPLELLQAIDLLPREKLPESAQEWSIMLSFWESIGLNSDYQFSRRALLTGNRATLKEYLFVGLCCAGYQRSYEKLHGYWQGDLGHLSDVEDYFCFVRQWYSELRPETSDLGENPIADDLLKRYAAMELIRQSDAWHRQIHAIQVSESPNARPEIIAQWPGLPRLPWTGNGLSIIALQTPEALHAEGLHLDHCVATYAPACILGKCHIVSIRDADGQPLSTAEISLASKGNAIFAIVRQHRSQVNRTAATVCIEVLNTWLAGWAEESIQSELRQLTCFHANETRRIEVLSLLQMPPEYSAENMSQLMHHVLPDYEVALAWLEQQPDAVH